MHRLIINADDLGINSQRSHGIFECAEFGVVKSATLVPNGDDAEKAGKHARERGLPCGLQITLTQGNALSKPDDVPTLINTHGTFFESDRVHQLLDEEGIEHASLEREIRAQVEWCLDVHGSITHISGTDHIHVHPVIAKIIVPIMERYGIRAVCMPIEEPLPHYGYVTPEELLASVIRVNQASAEARELYRAQGIVFPDHFRGATLLGNASLKNLRHVISRLPEGTTEIMVHPGSAITFGTPFDLDPQRQTELRMLLDPSIPIAIADRRIGLCTFGDL